MSIEMKRYTRRGPGGSQAQTSVPVELDVSLSQYMAVFIDLETF